MVAFLRTSWILCIVVLLASAVFLGVLSAVKELTKETCSYFEAFPITRVDALNFSYEKPKQRQNTSKAQCPYTETLHKQTNT